MISQLDDDFQFQRQQTATDHDTLLWEYIAKQVRLQLCEHLSSIEIYPTMLLDKQQRRVNQS